MCNLFRDSMAHQVYSSRQVTFRNKSCKRQLDLFQVDRLVLRKPSVLTALILRGPAPVLVFIWRSEYSKYSVPSASMWSCTSPQVIYRCSSQPPEPKCTELKSHTVFSKASAFEWDSEYILFVKNVFLHISQSFSCVGFVPFSFFFFSCLLRASRHFLAWSNAMSSRILVEYLRSFKCRLKLENYPRRL